MNKVLPERMREIALDLPVPDDMTNREYWLRTEIMQWADAYEALEQQVAKQQDALLEANVTLESIDDKHPQTEYAVDMVTAATTPDLEGSIKDLTFYMGDKTTDELWAIVREECRRTTPAWRAYERLHSEFNQMLRRSKRPDQDG